MTASGWTPRAPRGVCGVATSTKKQFRRLLKRPDVHVVRAYELDVAEVHDVEREALLTRVEEYFRGQASRYSEFELGDFRDATHRVVLMVQESC